MSFFESLISLCSYAVSHPDVFWAYRFLEFKDWIGF